MSNVSAKSKKHQRVMSKDVAGLIIAVAREKQIDSYDTKADHPMLVNPVNKRLRELGSPLFFFHGKPVVTSSAAKFRENEKLQALFREYLRGLAITRPDVAKRYGFDAKSVNGLDVDTLVDVRAEIAHDGFNLEDTFFYPLGTESAEYRSPVADTLRRIIEKPVKSRPIYTIDQKLDFEKLVEQAEKKMFRVVEADIKKRTAEKQARQTASVENDVKHQNDRT